MARATATPARRYASIIEAADYAAVTPKTIRRRIADGTLPAYSGGRRLIRVDLNDIDAWLRPIPNGAA